MELKSRSTSSRSVIVSANLLMVIIQLFAPGYAVHPSPCLMNELGDTLTIPPSFSWHILMVKTRVHFEVRIPFQGLLSWNSSLKTMPVCAALITYFALDSPPAAEADLISLMTKTSSPCWSQRHFCTVTLRRSWKGSGLIKWNILMQRGIPRSVQWDVRLIRAAVYLLLDGEALHLPLREWPLMLPNAREIWFSIHSLYFYIRFYRMT